MTSEVARIKWKWKKKNEVERKRKMRSNNVELSRHLHDGKRKLMKDMQTNEKEKAHDRPVKKSETRKSVPPLNVFGSFLVLIQFHMLCADPIFRADGLCLSIKHFFLSCANKFFFLRQECSAVFNTENGKACFKDSRSS